MKYITSMAVCLALAAPAALYAQSDAPEEDGVLDLDSIDALLGDRAVTGDEDQDDDAAAEVDEDAAEEEAAEEEEAPQLSDLTLAFNAYSLCASEAGAGLEESGFALDVIGQESLLHCSGQRAAYVNAFYFSLVPHFPNAGEAEVRSRAERLVAQSDTAIANVVTREVTDLREIRELDAAAEAEEASEDELDAVPDEPSDDDGADAAEDTDDGVAVEDEMEPDAQD